MCHLQQLRDSIKGRGKNWVFLSKQFLEAQAMACQGLGMVFFNLVCPLKKPQHTAPPPPPPIGGTNG